MRDEKSLFDGDSLDAGQTLFRYLSFSRLMNLLVTQRLYLPRIDQFADPLEGRFTNQDLRYLAHPPNHVGVSLPDVRESLGEIRSQAYASCWAVQSRESDAHWRLYSAREECLAIVTRVQSLDGVFRNWQPDWPNASYGLGAVRYIDHLRDEVASEADADGYRKSLLRVFALKNDSFRWEEEARAIVLPRNSQWGLDSWPRGVEVPFDATRLIERIVVNPSSAPWYLSTVRACVEAYGLAERVVPSELSGLSN